MKLTEVKVAFKGIEYFFFPRIPIAQSKGTSGKHSVFFSENLEA